MISLCKVCYADPSSHMSVSLFVTGTMLESTHHTDESPSTTEEDAIAKLKHMIVQGNKANVSFSPTLYHNTTYFLYLLESPYGLPQRDGPWPLWTKNLHYNWALCLTKPA